MKKLGILGGGQLGKMLCLAAADWDIETFVLDKKNDFPAAKYCHHFIEGDFNNFDDVYSFGKKVDVLTIEIEHVNIDALLQLEAEGLTVCPSPSALKIIKDKGLQKQFYEQHLFPTTATTYYDNTDNLLKAIEQNELKFPFVQKLRSGGYDGNGVAIIKSKSDISKILNGASIVEPLVDLQKEIAVIAARNERGEVACFSAVEMEFNPTANLVEFLFSPANINPLVAAEAEILATKLIEAFDICGLLAVEFFLTIDNQLLINEVAPRPHNSGHHTIDATLTSQFQQHIRAVLNFPLGSTKDISPAVMINVLGEDGFVGDVLYQGMEKVLEIEGVNIHLYGKKQTKPFRKMGHITVVDDSLENAVKKARKVQQLLKVVSK